MTEKQSDGRVEVVKGLVGKAKDVLMMLFDLLTLAALGKSHPVLDDEEALGEVSGKLDALAEGLTAKDGDDDLPDGEVDTTAGGGDDEPETAEATDGDDKGEEATEPETAEATDDDDGEETPTEDPAPAGEPAEDDATAEATEDGDAKKDGGGSDTDEDAKE